MDARLRLEQRSSRERPEEEKPTTEARGRMIEARGGGSTSRQQGEVGTASARREVESASAGCAVETASAGREVETASAERAVETASARREVERSSVGAGQLAGSSRDGVRLEGGGNDGEMARAKSRASRREGKVWRMDGLPIEVEEGARQPAGARWSDQGLRWRRGNSGWGQGVG